MKTTTSIRSLLLSLLLLRLTSPFAPNWIQQQWAGDRLVINDNGQAYCPPDGVFMNNKFLEENFYPDRQLAAGVHNTPECTVYTDGTYDDCRLISWHDRVNMLFFAVPCQRQKANNTIWNCCFDHMSWRVFPRTGDGHWTPCEESLPSEG